MAEKLYMKDKKDQIRNKTITSIKIKSLNCHLFFVTPGPGVHCASNQTGPRERGKTPSFRSGEVARQSRAPALQLTSVQK